jgi:hypothetical protein
VDIGYTKQQLCAIEKEKLEALGYKLKIKVLCEDERLNLFHFVKQKGRIGRMGRQYGTQF